MDMDFDARMKQAEERMKLLKEGIQIAADAVKMDQQNERDRKLDQLNDTLDAFDAKLDEYDQRILEKMDKEIDDLAVYAAVMEAQANEDAKAIKGDIEAARENLRLADEYSTGKLNSSRLRAQMNLSEARARKIRRLEEMDKEAWSLYICDLFDYAENCQDMAEAYAYESKLALTQARDEIKLFEEKYGPLR